MLTPSVKYLKSSDNTGDAAVATVQTVRAPGASTILVDTVDNIPAFFMGSMGTPHTFIDPVTSETITVISESSAVDFYGHVSSTHLEIDGISPGYADTHGSAVGDIIIIKPTTDWANNVAALFEASHNDDGSLMGSAVRTALGQSASVGAGWTTLGNNPNTITYNGNRSYTCVFNAVDLSDTLSNGMRMLFARNTAAPTKCTSLNGTTQYFSKTSPAGMTFTDDFVVSAWVKLTSYVTNSTIVSRYNGTSGWSLQLSSSGQVSLFGFNAGAGNYALSQSYQSIPLNKWVHVAAQLDMTTTSVGGTNNYIMFDGVEVPNAFSRAGTNPTALVQAGNLEIGSSNGGTNLWPGKIAQVAIFNAKVTQATLRGYISQGLVGTETSLVSAYSFNNSINDLSASSNNLTANGSATATNADSPFAQGASAGTSEYGVVTGVSYSTNTSVTIQVPEGCALPTSGTILNSSYSTMRSPYGFPSQRGKWQLVCQINISNSTTLSVNGTWVATPFTFVEPIGEWTLGWSGTVAGNTTGAASVRSVAFNLASSLPTASNYAYPLVGRVYLNPNNTYVMQTITRAVHDAVSSPTTYTLYGVSDSITATETATVRGDQGVLLITADCDYI